MPFLRRPESGAEQPDASNGEAGESLSNGLSQTAPRPSQADIALKNRVLRNALIRLDPSFGSSDAGQEHLTDLLNHIREDAAQSQDMQDRIEDLFQTVVEEEDLSLTRADKQRLFVEAAAEVLGFGIIGPLRRDDDITAIMTAGRNTVYVERNGILEPIAIPFQDDEHLLRIIDELLSPGGIRVDTSIPVVHTHLPDGSDIVVAVPPVAVDGASLTIRKSPRNRMTVQDLINYGSTTVEIMEFLRACVIAKFNIIISGGAVSGKTTLLNILCGFIPADERIITIEHSLELLLRQNHVIRLESPHPSHERRGEVTVSNLVASSMYMRPDRIIVGELRGGEALGMILAMNTGYEGSMSTVHSHDLPGALARLETMCLMAGMELPVRAIRKQMSSAVHLIVHVERLGDGSRKITRIAEVQGMEGDVMTLADLFEFEQTGMDGQRIVGRIRPTGLRPKNINRIINAGLQLPPAVFGVGRY
jgi:pilus assembly protein CpaF